MSNIKQITLPDATTYNVGNGNRGVFYGTCSTDAATATKAVVCNDFEAADLLPGTIVNVLFSATNSAAVADLKLDVNSTSAKSIKYIYNGSYTDIPAAGYLKANQIYKFTYDGTYWVVEMIYNTNTNTYAYKVYLTDAKRKVYTASGRYMICFTRDEDYILPATAVDNTTGTSKALTTEAFDPFGNIFYYNSKTALAANAVIANSTLEFLTPAIDLRYSFNTGSTLTANKLVYVVCDPQSNGKVKLATTVNSGTPPITQSLPSSADNKVYILLGVAYDTYRICLLENHPVYYYADGALRLWTNPASNGSSDKSVQIPLSNFTYTAAMSGTATSAYSFTQIKNMLDSGIYPWLQIYDSANETSHIYHPVTYFYDDDIIQFSDLTGKYQATLEETDVSVIHFSESSAYAKINSPSFTGAPTAPTPTPLDNSTKIATTAWVNSKINLAIPEIEEAAMKVKIYYVIPGDDPSGQDGYWSGQDYASYTLGSCGIYVDSEGTTLISSTQQLTTDISNGIIPVLNVIDQDGHYVLCYPNWIEDDTLVVDFIGIVNSTNREFIALKIGVDIDNSIKGIYSGYYLINSGLPTVTSSDNGKFLRVVNGAWAAASVPNANGVSF